MKSTTVVVDVPEGGYLCQGGGLVPPVFVPFSGVARISRFSKLVRTVIGRIRIARPLKKLDALSATAPKTAQNS